MQKRISLPGSAAILVIVIAATLSATSNAWAQGPRYDLLLKGGHVIDPSNHLDAVMDVAVLKDKIAAVEKDIPAAQAAKVVNASGLFVTPGLIDIHFHVGHGGAPLDWFAPEARSIWSRWESRRTSLCRVA